MLHGQNKGITNWSQTTSDSRTTCAFHKWDQHVRETVSELVIELRHLALTCSFGNFLDKALRGHSVCVHAAAHNKGTDRKDLTLQKAIKMP